MYLTPEQQAILDGSKGETMAKVMKTLVMYGETFGAEKMVPVSSKYNHLVTSFGLKMMKPVFDLMQQLIDAGALSQQKFSVDPRPLDKNVPANFLQNFIFNNFMYSKQEDYEEQLRQLKLPPAVFYPLVRLGALLDGGFGPNKVNVPKALQNAKVPILFFHGDADAFVPCEMSRENYAACSSDKRLVITPDAGHGLCFPIDEQAYIAAVKEFDTQYWRK